MRNENAFKKTGKFVICWNHNVHTALPAAAAAAAWHSLSEICQRCSSPSNLSPANIGRRPNSCITKNCWRTFWKHFLNRNPGLSRSFQGYINPSRDNSWKSVSELRSLSLLKGEKSLFQINPYAEDDHSFCTEVVKEWQDNFDRQ